MRQLIPSLRLNKTDTVPALAQYLKVINWGTVAGALENVAKVLNKPSAVAKARDKIKTLDILKEQGINVPIYWKTRETVQRTEAEIVLARTTTTGSSGAGIVVVRNNDPLPAAPLYVKYIPKSAEYRVHVFKTSAIFIQQKRPKEGVERTPDQHLIRSHDNGYVFAENNVEFSSEEVKTNVNDQAIKAVRALGLDFGAVDLIVGKKDKKVYVLEINTKPGLESTKLKEAYRDAILN